MWPSVLWRPEDNLQESVLFLYYVGIEHGLLGSMAGAYSLLSHLAGLLALKEHYKTISEPENEGYVVCCD